MTQERGAAVSKGPSAWVKTRTFFRDSWLELKKVIWPSREEVVKMTGFVVLVVTVVGLFIYLWDLVLGQLTMKLFGR